MTDFRKEIDIKGIMSQIIILVLPFRRYRRAHIKIGARLTPSLRLALASLERYHIFVYLDSVRRYLETPSFTIYTIRDWLLLLT